MEEINAKKSDNELVRKMTEEKYKYGFTTDVNTEIIERGLNEDIIRLISAKKGEPDWLLEFRLKAYRYWLTLEIGVPTMPMLGLPVRIKTAASFSTPPMSMLMTGRVA